jgi:hypothetical protein
VQVAAAVIHNARAAVAHARGKEPQGGALAASSLRRAHRLCTTRGARQSPALKGGSTAGGTASMLRGTRRAQGGVAGGRLKGSRQSPDTYDPGTENGSRVMTLEPFGVLAT